MSDKSDHRAGLKQINRRSLMQLLGGFGGAALSFGSISSLASLDGWIEHGLAQTRSGGRYFIHLCFDGGWDLLLGLDPRSPQDFPDTDVPITGIETGYHRLPVQFSRSLISTDHFDLGPCAQALQPWSEKIALIRGMDMATLTHEVGRRHLNTAVSPIGLSARGSSVTARAAALTMGEGEQAIPHFAHLVETYNQDLPSEVSALTVSSVDHLQYLLQDTLGIPSYMPANIRGALNRYWDKQHQAYQDHWREHPATGTSQRMLERALKTRAQARALVKHSLHTSFQFNSPAQANLRNRYGITIGQLDTPRGRAALAAQTLKTGLSRSVNLSLVTGLDTHDQSWARDHSVRLDEGFTALALLLSDLAESADPLGGGSLLEQTTLVVTSEFSRTPRLNERGGRDHHLSNAALLIGRGIQGGQIIGATSPEYMSPLKIDLETGSPTVDGASIRPEELMRTALKALGFDVPETEIRGGLLSPVLTELV